MKAQNSRYPINTYCEIDGVYHDSVAVFVDASPAEPDVNFGGSFEVTGVYLEDQGDMMDHMTDEEIKALEDRLYQEACEAEEDSPC